MIASIHDINEARPHVVIVIDKDVYVYPLKFLEDIAEGKLGLSSLENKVLCRIIEEWLELIQE